jgi:nicotinate-nucleotide--dimethylbenzimidazole phosphoribosyltransferase
VERCSGLPIVEALAEVGALEVCALIGFIVGAARRRTPVVLDGVTTLAAALAASEISPHSRDHLIAGHRSPEPAVDVALAHLGLEPMVDFGLRVGEGTGALLALPLLAAGCEILSSVARLDEVT